MATQRHTSTFSSGAVQDVTPLQQPAGTFRHGRNVRILHNTDPNGQVDAGRTLDIALMAGTQKAWSLPVGYTSIAEIDTDLGLIVFSHNGHYSEIGRVDPDSDASLFLPPTAYRPEGFRYAYYTLFNDAFDPNGELLDLPSAPHCQLTTTQENSLISRLSWAVGNKGLRVLNLRLCYDEAGQPYHDAITGGIRASYPRHLSVHQMEVLPDVGFGSLDYEQRIDGALLSGGYQVTYRYRSKDGHASPFAPIHTRPYFVSDKSVPTNPQVSHHARYMGPSGVNTTDGLRFRLTDVDLRWDTLEVAVLYHRGAVGAERALLTHRIPLSTNPSQKAFIWIDLTSFSGTSLNTAEFLSQQQHFETVQTVASANNQLYIGGVRLTPALMADTSQVRSRFVEQLFQSDQTVAPTFTPKVNPENPSRKDGDKLTNTQPITGSRSSALYLNRDGQTVSRTLPINNDYDHNKGVQVATRFTSYRRGETYPFAIVCRDTKGIPYFAVPLADVTFPDWAVSPPVRNRSIKIPVLGLTITLPIYFTAHLGVAFDGIRLPVDMVYEPSGKRRLGSIEIVRGQASGRIGFQAVAVNCTVNVPENSTTAESDQGFKKIEPHASWNNGFKLPNTGLGGGPSHYGPHWTKTENTNVINQGAIIEISFKGRTDNPTVTINKAYWVTLHAPDVMTTGVLPDIAADPSGRLEMLGAAHGSAGNEIRLDIAEQYQFPGDGGGPLHVYTKNYKTNGQLLAGGDQNGRPQVGQKSRIKTWFRHNKERRDATYANIDPENDKLVFSPVQSLFPQYREGAFGGTTQREYRLRWGDGGNPRFGQSHWEWNYVDAMLAPGSVVACLKDWEAVDVIESPSSYVSLAVVNYVKGADPQPATDERTYVPTGYFLPVTDELLASLPTDTDKSGRVTAYVLNGAEVYGGDTFVNPVDFCRLYPLWDEGCQRRNTYTPDFGVGHIVPIESKYNYALRQGRSLANNGMYSQSAACENQNLHATGGIAWGQPEEWNINDVLVASETIARYKPIPATVKLADDRQASIFKSQQKINGERDDSFRQWRPLDYVDLEGTFGPVMRMESVLNGIYVWQVRDYGRLRARDRAIIATSVGELTTGTGRDLDGLDYAQKGVGLHEFNALVVTPSLAYWVDTERKHLCRISQAGFDNLSDREHFHDLLALTIPDRDGLTLALGIDITQGDLWVTYGQTNTSQVRTLIYNEKLDAFVNDKTDCQPLRYCRWRRGIYGVSRLAIQQTEQLGLGPVGVFFGKAYGAELGWIVNPLPGYDKTFDNIAISVEGHQALTQLSAETKDDFHVIDLREGNDRRVAYRFSRLCLPLMNRVPRVNQRADARLRGQYLRLLLQIDPGRLPPGQVFALSVTDTMYRVTPKV